MAEGVGEFGVLEEERRASSFPSAFRLGERKGRRHLNSSLEAGVDSVRR